MTEQQLKPCPACGRLPNRFFVGWDRIEVIACPKGCKSHPLGMIIHVTSKSLCNGGYADLAEVWNSMEITRDVDGKLRGHFWVVPPHMREVEQVGPFVPWSPEVSRQKFEARAADAMLKAREAA
jgi:hypothetical protein